MPNCVRAGIARIYRIRRRLGVRNRGGRDYARAHRYIVFNQQKTLSLCLKSNGQVCVERILNRTKSINKAILYDRFVFL